MGHALSRFNRRSKKSPRKADRCNTATDVGNTVWRNRVTRPANHTNNDLIIYNDATGMLEMMERWVEDMMDSGDRILAHQARILISKVHEGRYVLQRAWALSDHEDLAHIHGIIERVFHCYDPHGLLHRTAMQIYYMLWYLETTVRPEITDITEASLLNAKLEEAHFLVFRTLNKRDEGEIVYLCDIITRMTLSYQERYAPYKDKGKDKESKQEKEKVKFKDRGTIKIERLSIGSNIVKKMKAQRHLVM